MTIFRFNLQITNIVVFIKENRKIYFELQHFLNCSLQLKKCINFNRQINFVKIEESKFLNLISLIFFLPKY